MITIDGEQAFTGKETALILNRKTPATVTRYCKQGKLKSVLLGKTRYYKASDIKAFADAEERERGAKHETSR